MVLTKRRYQTPTRIRTFQSGSFSGRLVGANRRGVGLIRVADASETNLNGNLSCAVICLERGPSTRSLMGTSKTERWKIHLIFEEYVEPKNSLCPDALRCQPCRHTQTQLPGTRRSPDVREHGQTNVGALSSFIAETSIAFIDTCNQFTSFRIKNFLFADFVVVFCTLAPFKRSS